MLRIMVIFTTWMLLVSSLYAQERSQAAKAAFKQANPCPANGRNVGACPGYVIDHIVALACSGADDPSNMQWQNIIDSKVKDHWERRDCSVGRTRRSAASGWYYRGSKGGCFTFSGSGRKRYVNRAFCW